MAAKKNTFDPLEKLKGIPEEILRAILGDKYDKLIPAPKPPKAKKTHNPIKSIDLLDLSIEKGEETEGFVENKRLLREIKKAGGRNFSGENMPKEIIETLAKIILENEEIQSRAEKTKDKPPDKKKGKSR